MRRVRPLMFARRTQSTLANPGLPAKRNTLHLQVLVAIVVGVTVGYVWPDFGASLKPLGDGCIKLVKMLIAPIIFATVVVGLAGMGDLKKVGRVGVKVLLYFEVVSTLALVIGLVVANVFEPGAAVHANAATLDAKAVAGCAKAAIQGQSPAEFFCTSFPTRL